MTSEAKLALIQILETIAFVVQCSAKYAVPGRESRFLTFDLNVFQSIRQSYINSYEIPQVDQSTQQSSFRQEQLSFYYSFAFQDLWVDRHHSFLAQNI